VVTVNWDTYGGCPAGTVVTEYDITVTNGSAADSNPILPSQQTIQVTLGTTGTTVVTYTATCTGSLVSAASPPLNLAITGP
jgi:hypothetical protein